MRLYSFFKKIIRGLLSIVIISGALFYLRTLSESDPVKLAVLKDVNLRTIEQKETKYAQISKAHGLDKPLFFWSILPSHYPDTLIGFEQQYRKELLESYFYKYKDWSKIEHFNQHLNALEKLKLENYSRLKQSATFRKTEGLLERLFIEKDAEIAQTWIAEMLSLPSQDSVFIPTLRETQSILEGFQLREEQSAFFIPKFKWHGFDNQYFNWLSACLRFDFGKSIVKKRTVNTLFGEHIQWTLLINVIAFLCSLILSIVLSLWFTGRNRYLDRAYRLFLFMVASVPVFWIAKMALLNLSRNNYAFSFGLFKTRSTMIWKSDVWATLSEYGEFLILPILCLTIVEMVGLSLQLIYKIKEEQSQPYLLALQARGLSPSRIRWKHLLKNTALPLLTLLAARLPALLLGSLIIEIVFNIKGMGVLFMEAVQSSDWFLMNAIVMAFAILVVIFNILGDWCIQWADPRLKAEK